MLAALAVAAMVVPASADHCPRVIIFSGVAGRGVNAGVGGCTTEIGDTNIMVPGAQTAIVGWTGGRASKPAGSLTVGGETVHLTGARWDAMRMYWTFDGVPLRPGATTLRATVYPESDPTRTETVTYTKTF